MKAYILVELDLPKHMDDEDIAVYVQDSTRACVGGYHPDDPVFQLDRKSVKAHYIQIRGAHEHTDFQNLKTLRDAINGLDHCSIHPVSDDDYGS